MQKYFLGVSFGIMLLLSTVAPVFAVTDIPATVVPCNGTSTDAVALCTEVCTSYQGTFDTANNACTFIPGSSFGDGTSQIDWSTAITNVPMMSWNDQLMYRVFSSGYQVEIFGVNVDDLQNGNVSWGDFVINILNQTNGGQDSLPSPESIFANISFENLVTGNFNWSDLNLPGTEITEPDFIYDYYYHINAHLNLNGRIFDKIVVYFGSDPNALSTKIAEFDNPGQNIIIDEYVYNQLNSINSEQEDISPMFVNKDYYVGVYGVNLDGDNVIQNTLAIKKLHNYSRDTFRTIVNFSPSPYLSIVGNNSIKFSFSGNLIDQNQIRKKADLRFGYNPLTFKKVSIYPEYENSINQDLSFNRTIQDLYAFYVDDTTLSTQYTQTALPLRPDTTYYVGVYEGEEMVYFMEAGRTPKFTNPTNVTPEPSPEQDTASGSMFSTDPFADLAQELSTGLVPCDGVHVSCDFNKFIELIQRVIKFVILMIIPMAAIAFAYAGYLLIFQGSSPDKRSQARDIIIKVFVGIAIVLGAWLIVKTILVALGVSSASIFLQL